MKVKEDKACARCRILAEILKREGVKVVETLYFIPLQIRETEMVL